MDLPQRAQALLSQGRFGQALPLYRRLHGELGARDRSTLLHFGYCLEQVGELDEAIEQYRDAVMREPGFLEAHINLAGVLWRTGDFEGSLAHARVAVRLAPAHAPAVRILGTALLNLNRLEQAETHLRKALELQPGLVPSQVDLAFTLLLAGRLQEGWTWYEKRWHDPRMQRPPFFDPSLEWQGPAQPLEGRSLVVYAEQGLGDAVQFLRYLPRLQQLGAAVTLAAHPELLELVESSFDGVHCLRPGQGLTADLHVALLDLPGRLGTTLESIPAQVPYLRPPATALAHWQKQLLPWKDSFKVGIAWCGDQRQVNNRNRAVALSEWQAVWQLEGVQCFSLQKSDAGSWTDVQPAQSRLVDLTAAWHGLADSAAMLEQLDLVVTVDTSIAHLAGALDKPAWVLLPPNPDFRWGLERDDSPWYPSLRLFRRDFAEPRAAQIARVLAALHERLARRGTAA